MKTYHQQLIMIALVFFDLDATNDFQSIKSIEDNITLITGPESGFSKKEREFLNATTSSQYFSW